MCVVASGMILPSVVAADIDAANAATAATEGTGEEDQWQELEDEVIKTAELNWESEDVVVEPSSVSSGLELPVGSTEILAGGGESARSEDVDILAGSGTSTMSEEEILAGRHPGCAEPRRRSFFNLGGWMGGGGRACRM